mmetsp:Transcript_47088/g.140544  ORF Transcript_47088/g.140544 Transcript_47088/m.140544 type:complete len:283 (+) Transcript_47088:89-937(+)
MLLLTLCVFLPNSEAVRATRTDAAELSVTDDVFLRAGGSQQNLRSARFCMSEETHMSCDDEEVIAVGSAFYNDRKDKKCGPVEEPGKQSCQRNSTDLVASHCDGVQDCILPTSVHWYCSEKPYTTLRVTWQCVLSSQLAGKPVQIGEDADEEDEADEFDPEPAALKALNDDPGPKEDAESRGVAALGRERRVGHWCTSQAANLECERGVIEVSGAYYNRRKVPECTPHHNDVFSCRANATQMVADACHGVEESCSIAASAHWHCDIAPFTFIRVVWNCVTGQ